MDRPALHFTPSSGWMNDPNGLIWHDGLYHLYYQSEPTGRRPVFGGAAAAVGWGHATSADLVHWRHLPMALAPVNGDERLHARYSGSAVADRDNVSGLGTIACPTPLLAFFTDLEFERRADTWQPIRQPICLAYSLDGGDSFVPFAGNPVIPTQERKFGDPKVFWHEESARWIMVNIRGMDQGRIELYGSTDLLRWDYLSDVQAPCPGRWECPDLFPLTTVSGERHWVLKFNAPRQYLAGQFDGVRFTVSQELPCPSVGPFYAEVTFNDVPDGRRLLMGWLPEAPDPARPWVGMQSIPRELSLRGTPDGLRLVQEPVRELLACRRGGRCVARTSALGDGHAWELAVPETTGSLTLQLDDGTGWNLSVDAVSSELTWSGGGRSGVASLPCRVFLDHRVVEVFADAGQRVITAVLPLGRVPVSLAWTGALPLTLWDLAV